jgi:23S rRNA (guanine2445-N2)-methyltransferase / 23S rRNA (guanine2069-N7)-methyltransferase
VRIERRELADLTPPFGIDPATPGLVVANPPYGRRLGASARSGRRSRDGTPARGRELPLNRQDWPLHKGTSGKKAAIQEPADAALATLYELLGQRLRTGFSGWKAAVLVNDLELGKHLGLRARRANRFMNGPLPCTLLRFEIDGRATLPKRSADVEPAGVEPAQAEPADAVPARRVGAPPRCPIGQDVGQLNNVPRALHVLPSETRRTPDTLLAPDTSRTPDTPRATGAPRAARAAFSPAADQFANRLRKNARRWSRYMRRAGVTCYRVYDADLPDFALAIDVYERWVHVQEYAPPPEIDEAKAAARLAEAMSIVPDVLSAAPDDVFLKVRARQRGAAQYLRRAAHGVEHEVHERDLSFLVNFTDYLDTGLFLPGREVRRLLGELATGQRFLNLFGYTGAASVAAGRSGAASTTTVDLNGAYLEWAQRNFAVNKLKAGRNAVVEADVLQWVAQTDERFGLIYLDPPTFSNSKKMGRATFDVRRDHADLIRLVARRLLTPGGVLVFACNARRFALDTDVLARDHELEDLSRATLPPDFARAAKAHHVWRITARR